MSQKNGDQLWQRLKQATTLSEYRRIQCVYLREKYSYTSNQIADITTYHPASVRRIQSEYRKHGVGALSPKPKGGRNSIRLLFCLSFVCLAGCGATVSSPLTGVLYTEVQGPVETTGHTINEGYASGSATATSILGLIAAGDASIDTAARNGGITKIYYVDYETTSLLGLFGTYTVIVYGERGEQADKADKADNPKQRKAPAVSQATTTAPNK